MSILTQSKATNQTSVEPESHEEVVQMLWRMIVTEWFPGRQGYEYEIKAQVLANDNAPGVVIFQILALNPNPQDSEDVMERQILLIECKRPSFDTLSGWYNTITGQFFDDLTESGNTTNRLYGAVAIGKKVRFFRFDGRGAVANQKQNFKAWGYDIRHPNEKSLDSSCIGQPIRREVAA